MLGYECGGLNLESLRETRHNRNHILVLIRDSYNCGYYLVPNNLGGVFFAAVGDRNYRVVGISLDSDLIC